MANPTTNFGWVMPTSTDLVTDLPADFAVFGQAVDTSMADLKGGTTGQILAKATNTDMDFTWITNDQGDITAVNTTAPLAGGGTSGALTLSIAAATTSVAGAVQLSDSTSTTSSVLAATPTAVKSAYDLAAAAIPKSTVTTAGDVIYATGSSTVSRLGLGTAGQVLTVNTGATAPEWKTPSGGSSGPTFKAYRATSGQSFTQNTVTKIQFNAEEWDTASSYDPTTNYRFTPTTSGYYSVNLNVYIQTGGTGDSQMSLRKNGSSVLTAYFGSSPSNYSPAVNGLVFLNGSTDYIEGFIFSAATSPNVLESQTNSYFSAVWIRS